MSKRDRMSLPEKIFVSMAGVLLTTGAVGVVAAIGSRNQLNAQEGPATQNAAPNPTMPETQGVPPPSSTNPVPLPVPMSEGPQPKMVHEEPSRPEITTNPPPTSTQAQAPLPPVTAPTVASQPSSPTVAGITPSPNANTPASMLQRVEPTPPRGLSRNQLPPDLRDSEIKVTAKVFVGVQGKPLKVMVQSVTVGAFGYDDSAKQAALQSTYAPATRGGVPINSWITVEYNFGKPK